MGYLVERVPLPTVHGSGRVNPIADQMRQLEVGESFAVEANDPHWRGALIANENRRKQGHFIMAWEGSRRRIFRDR